MNVNCFANSEACVKTLLPEALFLRHHLADDGGAYALPPVISGHDALGADTTVNLHILGHSASSIILSREDPDLAAAIERGLPPAATGSGGPSQFGHPELSS
jgi:hypothetical protein